MSWMIVLPALALATFLVGYLMKRGQVAVVEHVERRRTLVPGEIQAPVAPLAPHTNIRA